MSYGWASTRNRDVLDLEDDLDRHDETGARTGRYEDDPYRTYSSEKTDPSGTLDRQDRQHPRDQTRDDRGPGPRTPRPRDEDLADDAPEGEGGYDSPGDRDDGRDSRYAGRDYDREALLRRELEELQRVNGVLTGLIQTLVKAQGDMKTVSSTIGNADTLLDQWTRILSQTEHSARLLQNRGWAGATPDIQAMEAEEAEEQQRRAEAEEREAERQAREEAEAARRRAEEDARRPTSLRPRGSVRGRAPGGVRGGGPVTRGSSVARGTSSSRGTTSYTRGSSSGTSTGSSTGTTGDGSAYRFGGYASSSRTKAANPPAPSSAPSASSRGSTRARGSGIPTSGSRIARGGAAGTAAGTGTGTGTDTATGIPRTTSIGRGRARGRGY